MMFSILSKGFWFGLITGIILGLFFKWIEYLGWADVYALLLNVDFIPYLPMPLPEWIEFSLHLLVSVAIGIMYSIAINWRNHPWTWGLILGILPIPLFIPLTLLSERTPAIDDTNALVWWIIGHILYGLNLAVLNVVMPFVKSNKK
jgi:hypothetical protein